MARILVIDDDENVLKLVEMILGPQDHDVLGVSSAHDALTLVQKTSFDLVVLDLLMPEFSGIDFLNAVKALKSFSTPILILSGENSADPVLNAVRSGAIDYVVKPFKPETLLKKVEAILALKKEPTP